MLILDHQGRSDGHPGHVGHDRGAVSRHRREDPAGSLRDLGLQKALDHYRSGGMPVSQEIELGEGEPVMLDVSITVRGVDAAEGKTMLVFHDVTRLKKSSGCGSISWPT